MGLNYCLIPCNLIGLDWIGSMSLAPLFLSLFLSLFVALWGARVGVSGMCCVDSTSSSSTSSHRSTALHCTANKRYSTSFFITLVEGRAVQC